MTDGEYSMAERELELAIMDGTAFGLTPIRDPGCWKAKDGRLIPFADLTDDHLVNIIKMLIRGAIAKRAEKLASYMNGPRPSGAGAQDAFDFEFSNLLDASFREYVWHQFDELEAEVGSRSLEFDAEAYARGIQLPIELSLIRAAQGGGAE